jgi:hypothetical protein
VIEVVKPMMAVFSTAAEVGAGAAAGLQAVTNRLANTNSILTKLNIRFMIFSSGEL